MEHYDLPSMYRISTITATGSVGTSIDLDILYNCLEIDITQSQGLIDGTDTTGGTSTGTITDNIIANEDLEGIVYVEFGKKKSETFYKGYAKKYTIHRRKVKPSKRFDNQVTIVYRTKEQNNLNIKTFRNGNIQMTGIKNIDQGSITVDYMLNILRKIYENKDKNVIGDINDLHKADYKIRLINTDYKVGFQIKRDILYKVLKNEYGNICNYEPVIYPGVKIHYFYNESNSQKDGICKCYKKCHDLKCGTGIGQNNCKKITIAVFQSGCIIITGSQTKKQIDECYGYINEVLYKNVSRIEKKKFVNFEEALPPPKKIVFIPKSKIIKP